MKLIVIFFLCVFPFANAASAQTINADKIIGNWISPDNDLIVCCYKENNVYKSKVVWFKRYYDNSPDDPNGIPEDKWINSVVMDNFSFQGNEWIDGTIRNLKNGKTYTAYLKLNNDNELSVVGYICFRIFSETIVFKRYSSSHLPLLN